MTIRHERINFPPRGLLGGKSGSAGTDMVNGEKIPAKSRIELTTGDIVSFQTPGGGGLFPESEREPEMIEKDLISGLVSTDGLRDS